MKVGDLLAMTAMTLLDHSQNWGHFWKIKSIHGTYQYPTYAILNLCRGGRAKKHQGTLILGHPAQKSKKLAYKIPE
jgi:hypothetical protein